MPGVRPCALRIGALQAGLAEAGRRRQGLARGATLPESETVVPREPESVDSARAERIEDELSRLRAELEGEAD